MASNLQLTERRKNINSMLRVIRQSGEITRRELMSRLSLSWGCISELTKILVENGIISENKSKEYSAKGRTPSVLTLSSEMMVLGIDINNVGLSYCVCNLYGKKLFEETEPLRAESKDMLLGSVFSVIEKSRRSFPNIISIGFAMQGINDSSRGCWIFPGREMLRIDFVNDIASKIDIPVIVEHDPNCMLFDCVNDSTTESKMLVRIDGGIGAAIYRYNSFFDGGLLELGYTVTGEDCRRLSSVIQECEEDAGADDLYCAGKLLGIALGNLCNLIYLDEIILCGDLLKYEDEFLASLKEYYSQVVIDVSKAEITTRKIKNAAYGAAKLALDKFPMCNEVIC